MSLEALLEQNNKLLAEHNDLLRQVLSNAPGAKAGAKADAGAKAETKKADTPKGDEAFDDEAFKAVKQRAAAWIKEFTGNQNDPENVARGEKLKEALGKIGFKKISEINTADAAKRFTTWIDKRIAEGRITPEPTEEGDGDGSSDDEI